MKVQEEDMEVEEEFVFFMLLLTIKKALIIGLCSIQLKGMLFTPLYSLHLHTYSFF